MKSIARCFKKSGSVFFNLAGSLPGVKQEINLASEHPALVKELHERMTEMDASILSD